MEKRNKCDVIPVWMFRELDSAAKYTLREAKDKIQGDKEKQLKKIKSEKEKVAWNEIKGRPIEDCFTYSSGSYSSFSLKSKIQKIINRKKEALENKVKRKYGKKFAELDKKYEEWKMNVLTGKIPRSRIRGFKL